MQFIMLNWGNLQKDNSQHGQQTYVVFYKHSEMTAIDYEVANYNKGEEHHKMQCTLYKAKP